MTIDRRIRSEEMSTKKQNRQDVSIVLEKVLNVILIDNIPWGGYIIYVILQHSLTTKVATASNL